MHLKKLIHTQVSAVNQSVSIYKWQILDLFLSWWVYVCVWEESRKKLKVSASTSGGGIVTEMGKEHKQKVGNLEDNSKNFTNLLFITRLNLIWILFYSYDAGFKELIDHLSMITFTFVDNNISVDNHLVKNITKQIM